MAELEKKVVELSEEDLDVVSGGGILNRVPKVDENDYDDEVEEKAGGN